MRGGSRAEALRRAGDLIEQVGIASGRSRARAYPHQLSGGERQRAMIAMAIANRPKLLIADEPTTALDVTVQARILDLLVELQRETRHGDGLRQPRSASRPRDRRRVYVMREGVVVESGPVEEVLTRPRDPYTRMLVAAEPARRGDRAAAEDARCSRRADIRVTYLQPTGLFSRARRVRAVDGVSLDAAAPARPSGSSANPDRASRRSRARCCG